MVGKKKRKKAKRKTNTWKDLQNILKGKGWKDPRTENKNRKTWIVLCNIYTPLSTIRECNKSFRCSLLLVLEYLSNLHVCECTN
jgi:hypothetical protein